MSMNTIVNMSPRTEYDSLRQTEPCADRPLRHSGFTLIELIIVTVIIGLLAAIAIPQFNGVREKAFNATALSDLSNASKEIERFFNDFLRYPDDENELVAEGYMMSPGISFTTFSVRNAGLPDADVHMHIEHAGSPNYYHAAYPGEGPELRWK